jgi:hypothetical protein
MSMLALLARLGNAIYWLAALSAALIAFYCAWLLIADPHAYYTYRHSRIAGLALAALLWAFGAVVRYVLAGPRHPPTGEWGTDENGEMTWRRKLGTAREWEEMFATFAAMGCFFLVPALVLAAPVWVYLNHPQPLSDVLTVFGVIAVFLGLLAVWTSGVLRAADARREELQAKQSKPALATLLDRHRDAIPPQNQDAAERRPSVWSNLQAWHVAVAGGLVGALLSMPADLSLKALVATFAHIVFGAIVGGVLGGMVESANEHRGKRRA